MNKHIEKYQDFRSRDSNVIPFTLSSTVSTSEASIESLRPDLFTKPEIEAHLKGIVEAAVLDAWMRARLFDIERSDDPFDAIYICELKPDRIMRPDTDRILKYSNIIDLSDTISFDDEWEE